MIRLEAKDFSGVVGIISACNINPGENGNPVIFIKLWNGKIISASYYNGPKLEKPDLQTKEISFPPYMVEHLVILLIGSKKSFVTVMGTGDEVIKLEWKIEPKG